jgi:hypothetical protein
MGIEVGKRSRQRVANGDRPREAFTQSHKSEVLFLVSAVLLLRTDKGPSRFSRQDGYQGYDPLPPCPA